MQSSFSALQQRIPSVHLKAIRLAQLVAALAQTTYFIFAALHVH